MASFLGSSIERHDGVSGVIVNAARDATWGGGDSYVYDIVWSDKSFARKVTPDTISRSGWALREGRVGPSECNRIWMEFQIERSRQMAARHCGSEPGSRTARVAASPRTVSEEPSAAISETPARPASWLARQLIAEKFPDVEFAVNLDHRKLMVGWIDGPVEARVERALGSLRDQGHVIKLVTRRGVQAPIVHAAIEHVLQRICPNVAESQAKVDRQRLTPESFQSGLVSSVMTPLSSALGAYPYSKLIQCVIDRWDNSLCRFVDTERTRYLVQERSVLFPGGDEKESKSFGDLVHLLKQQQGGGEAPSDTEEFAQSDRARG